MADILNIPGKIHSTAADGRAVETNEVYDNNKETFQSSINANFEERITTNTSTIEAYVHQNFVTLTAQATDLTIADVFNNQSPAVTPALNTVYRVANWKGDSDSTFYNTSYYSEYSTNGTTTADLVLLDVVDKGIDNEPTAGSDNLVKSGGVKTQTNNISKQIGGNLVADIPFDKIITSEGTYVDKGSDEANLLNVESLRGQNITITAGSTQYAIIAFLTSDDISAGSAKFSILLSERQIIAPTETATFFIPEDCVYLYVRWKANGVIEIPSISVASSVVTLKKKCDTFLEKQENITNSINWILRGYFVNNSAKTEIGDTRIYGIIPNANKPYTLYYELPSDYKIAFSVWDGITLPAPSVGSGWKTGSGTYELPQLGLSWIVLSKTNDTPLTLDILNDITLKIWTSFDNDINRIDKDITSLNGDNSLLFSTINSGVLVPNIEFNKIIVSDGTYVSTSSSNYAKLLDVTALRGEKINITKNQQNNAIFAFLADKNTDSTPLFSFGETGRRVITDSSAESFTIPLDCKYLYAVVFNNNTDATPLITVENNGVSDETNNIELALNSELKQRIVWYQKTVSQITGNIADTALNRLSGVLYNIEPGTVIHITLPLEYDVTVSDWSDSYPKEQSTGWQPTIGYDYTVVRGKKVVITFRKRDNAYITPELLEQVSIQLHSTTKSNILPIIDEISTKTNVQLPCAWQNGILADNGVVQQQLNRAFAVVPINNMNIHTISYYSEKFKLHFRPWDGYVPISSSSSGWLYGKGVYAVPNANYILVGVQKLQGNISSLDELNDVKLYIDTELSKFAEEVSSSTLQKYYYEGERISIKNSFSAIIFKSLPNWQNMQGGAIFGDYLVCLMATDELSSVTANGFIYNLATGEKLCDLLFSSTLGGKTYTMPHANQVSFGTQYYNENSRFPLLYVSQVNGSSAELWESSERGVLVYDLQTQDEGITYTPVLVQAIIPDLTDTALMEKIGAGTPNYVVDTDKEQFVILGYPQERWGTSGPQPVTIINIPSINDGTEVVFTNSDVVDSYTFPVSLGIQQSIYYNGKVYSLGGAFDEPSLRMIDLDKKSVVTTIDLRQWLGQQEPQFIGIYNHKVLYYSADANVPIWKIIFD